MDDVVRELKRLAKAWPNATVITLRSRTMSRDKRGLSYVWVPVQKCQQQVTGDDLLPKQCEGVYIGRSENVDYFDCGHRSVSQDVAVTPEVARQLGYGD